MEYNPESRCPHNGENAYMEPEFLKNDNDKTVTVIVTGFPQKTCTNDVEAFMHKITAGNKSDVKVDTKNYFRGFVYVKFKFVWEAEQFINKEYVFQRKLLNCRISMQYYQFINESIENLRNPKKVFADRIPKHWCKKEVEKFFGNYGEIDYISLVDKDHKTVNFAYVTFIKTQSARDCVKSKLIKLKDKRKIKVEYSNPKFSANMLNKIHPILRRYIESVQNQSKNYDPNDFIYLQDIVLANESLYIDEVMSYLSKYPAKNSDQEEMNPKTKVSDSTNDAFPSEYNEEALAFDQNKLNLYDSDKTKNANTIESSDSRRTLNEFVKIDEQIKSEYGQVSASKTKPNTQKEDMANSDQLDMFNQPLCDFKPESANKFEDLEPYYVIECSDYENNLNGTYANQQIAHFVEESNPSNPKDLYDYNHNEYSRYHEKYNNHTTTDPEYVNQNCPDEKTYNRDQYAYQQQFYNQYETTTDYQDYITNGVETDYQPYEYIYQCENNAPNSKNNDYYMNHYAQFGSNSNSSNFYDYYQYNNDYNGNHQEINNSEYYNIYYYQACPKYQTTMNTNQDKSYGIPQHEELDLQETAMPDSQIQKGGSCLQK